MGSNAEVDEQLVKIVNSLKGPSDLGDIVRRLVSTMNGPEITVPFVRQRLAQLCDLGVIHRLSDDSWLRLGVEIPDHLPLHCGPLWWSDAGYRAAKAAEAAEAARRAEAASKRTRPTSPVSVSEVMEEKRRWEQEQRDHEEWRREREFQESLDRGDDGPTLIEYFGFG